MHYNSNTKFLIKETANKFIFHINYLDRLRKEITSHQRSIAAQLE